MAASIDPLVSLSTPGSASRLRYIYLDGAVQQLAVAAYFYYSDQLSTSRLSVCLSISVPRLLSFNSLDPGFVECIQRLQHCLAMDHAGCWGTLLMLMPLLAVPLSCSGTIFVDWKQQKRVNE